MFLVPGMRRVGVRLLQVKWETSNNVNGGGFLGGGTRFIVEVLEFSLIGHEFLTSVGPSLVYGLWDYGSRLYANLLNATWAGCGSGDFGPTLGDG